MQRSVPALQLMSRPTRSLAAPPSRGQDEDGSHGALASLIARASAAGTLPASPDHDTVALLRDELLALLTLAEDPPQAG
jgi:hypothetical protein